MRKRALLIELKIKRPQKLLINQRPCALILDPLNMSPNADRTTDRGHRAEGDVERKARIAERRTIKTQLFESVSFE